MTVEQSADVFLSATDIARLAAVRRPAVSNWRRRYPDFPRPVGGTATNPLFSWGDVEAWCERHGRTFAPTPADRIWLRSESLVGGAHMLEFLAHLGARLAHVDIEDLLEPPEAEWRTLLDEAVEMAESDDPRALYNGLCERFHETWARQEDDETSHGIADLMVAVADARQGQIVLDPACRTGVLPLAAERAGAGVFLLQTPVAARGLVAQARLLLGGHRCELSVGDALADDGFAGVSTIDTVLCDAPRETHWDQASLANDPRWVYGCPREPDLAWVQHCLARVRPGGTVVARLPAGTASRRLGRRIRTNLLRDGCVRAVVELPKSLDQSTHLWVLRRPRDRNDPPHTVLAISGAPDEEAIVAEWRQHAAGEAPGEYARAVPVADLLDADVDLTPATHLTDQIDHQVAERLPKVQRELIDLLDRTAQEVPTLDVLSAIGDDATPHAGRATTVGALVTQGKVRLLRSPNDIALGEGTLPVLTAQDLRLGRPPSEHTQEGPDTVVMRSGDVLVPPRGEGAPHVVREEGRVAVGPTLTLLRVDPDEFDPDFLAGFLGERGDGGRSTSGRSGIRNARVPLLPLERQQAYGTVLRGVAEVEQRLRRLSDLGEQWVSVARQAVRSGGVRGAEPR